MKKFVAVMLSAIFALALASTASAETFSPKNCLYVEANQNGLVTFRGDRVDIEKLTSLPQFCPDGSAAGCGDSFPAKSVGNGAYQLEMRAVRDGLRSFNGKSGKLWLAIPNPLVVVGSGLLIENSLPSPNSEDGKGGAHFTLVGDIGKANYKVLHPVVNQGGGACVNSAQASTPVSDETAVGEAKAELADLKREECKVLVKGDMVRSEVLLRLITAYWGLDVETRPGKGHDVIVTGAGGSRKVPISDKLLGQLKKLVGNPRAGDSLNSLCPEQAKLIREAIGDNCK